MKRINTAQIKLVSDFFANLSVIWFATAFINPTDPLATIKSIITGIITLIFGIYILKGVKNR